jgi:aldehyde:ferredoxin oxidoreductase
MVMGFKNLKAIACRGRRRLPVADPQAVTEIAGWVRDNAPSNNRSMRDHGTASVVKPLNASGGLPTVNFRTGVFEQAEDISGEAMSRSILARRRSCFACPIQCKREAAVDAPYAVDPVYGGPEYETIAAIGSNCGIGDLRAIAKGNELLNSYGLDSISCGMTISFAMECYERGLLTREDTGGVELRFGNAAAMLEMIEMIAHRRDIGDLLAEGSERASKRMGRGAEEAVLAIKGQEMSMHEPRWKQGMGIGYAMSPTGADHCHNMHDSAVAAPGRVLDLLAPLGILEALPVGDLSPAKMRMLAYYTHWMHFLNSAVCCYFVNIYGGMGLERTVQLVRAVTGWDVSLFELMKIGERSLNMARAFNAKEGLTGEADRLPGRFFMPHTSGPLADTAIDPAAFQRAKETYYGMMGWRDGVPAVGKLQELGLEWAASQA